MLVFTIMMMKSAEHRRDHRGALAAEVWVSSIAFGSLLGSAERSSTRRVRAGSPIPTRPPSMALIIAAVLGVGFGFFVGVLVGLVLAVFVFFGHRWLGVQGVATLMPLAALCITQPPAVLLGLVFSGSSMLIMITVNAALTLFGAWCIARRYRNLAQRLCLH